MSAESLKAETWTWFTVSSCVVVMRYVSRYMQLGSLRQFQFDDFLMVPVFGLYLGLIITVNIESHSTTNLMYPNEKLDPKTIPERTYGAIMAMVSEQCMLLTGWGCKACLLYIYHRMTKSLRPHFWVKVIAGYTATGLVIVELCWFFAWCRPFSGYWTVPAPNPQCATYNHHLILVACFNISSDILMLSIPLPLLAKASLPLRNKILLCGVFGLGIFVIVSATLSKAFSFMNPFSTNWFFWYTREASCAILVTNIPACWFLLRYIFTLPAFGSSGGGRGGSNTHSRVTSGFRNTASRLASHSGNDPVRSQKKTMWSHGKPGVRISSSASEENITGQEHQNKDIPLEIWRDVGVTIENHEDDRSSQDSNTKETYQAKISVV